MEFIVAYSGSWFSIVCFSRCAPFSTSFGWRLKAVSLKVYLILFCLEFPEVLEWFCELLYSQLLGPTVVIQADILSFFLRRFRNEIISVVTVQITSIVDRLRNITSVPVSVNHRIIWESKCQHCYAKFLVNKMKRSLLFLRTFEFDNLYLTMKTHFSKTPSCRQSRGCDIVTG